MRGKWLLEPLRRDHDLGRFDCGESSLNDYLRRYARQNARKDISRTHVAVVPGDPCVCGYYTISSGSVVFNSLPFELKRGLPRYPVPTTHIGRLAVDRASQGQGLGEVLLLSGPWYRRHLILHLVRLGRHLGDVRGDVRLGVAHHPGEAADDQLLNQGVVPDVIAVAE